MREGAFDNTKQMKTRLIHTRIEFSKMKNVAEAFEKFEHDWTGIEVF